MDESTKFFSDSYSLELLKNLSKHYADNLFCDVGLAISDSRILRAHRNILSASSPYFCAMFSGSLKEATSEVVSLQHIASANIIEMLIDFIYSGYCNIIIILIVPFYMLLEFNTS
jgi:hypothetical protein